ncbi:MAG: TonB-dependent receptor [Verrucomicrobia bacterium]|nr:TonB-dependent receptor [Verrucomicrobiota bacterium]
MPLPRGARVSHSRNPSARATLPKLVLAGGVHYLLAARKSLATIIALLGSGIVLLAQEATPTATPTPSETAEEPIVITATRVDTPLDQSPASVSVIDSSEFEEKQIERVADALREVPGLSVVQTGAPGQLTSVFTRGLRSEHTQVLLDGIPINQGLQGAFNFADLTVDDIDRIEVVRGPQSTLYGPRAMAGAIQLFTKVGDGPPAFTLSEEGGTYATFREAFQTSGKIDQFDYSISASRLDTDNARPNNEYRNTAAVADVGWSPNTTLRIGSLLTYSVSETGDPNSIFDPRPIDHFLTERWLIGPHLDWQATDWWEHKLVLEYDHERQVNNPNQDGFVGPTRALFERTQLDYQNNLRATSWLTITSGLFYSRVNAGQERPFVSQAFGPQPTFVSDHTEQIGAFAQLTFQPLRDLIFVSGARVDHFNQFGDIGTWREAASYLVEKTDTTLHGSIATGFSPPSSQDKIFGGNFGLQPERDLGWDAGIEQRLWNKRVIIGTTYFHNDLSNLIGYSGEFATLNLGAARTQGVECELRARPFDRLELVATYTYLDAYTVGAADKEQLPGARLPRRPRNEFYASASYLWFHRLRTTFSAKFVNAREDIDFNSPQTPPPNFDVEDYSFANFAAEYEINRHLTLFGRVDNLTNEHYAEVYGFPALGRAAYGGVRVSF